MDFYVSSLKEFTTLMLRHMYIPTTTVYLELQTETFFFARKCSTFWVSVKTETHMMLHLATFFGKRDNEIHCCVVSCYNLYAHKIVNFSSRHSVVLILVSFLEIFEKNCSKWTLGPQFTIYECTMCIVCDRTYYSMECLEHCT